MPKPQRISWDRQKLAEEIDELLGSREPTEENLASIIIPLGQLYLSGDDESLARRQGEQMLSIGLQEFHKRRARRRRAAQYSWWGLRLKWVAGSGVLIWLFLSFWTAYDQYRLLPCECKDIIALASRNEALVHQDTYEQCIDKYITIVNAIEACREEGRKN